MYLISQQLEVLFGPQEFLQHFCFTKKA